MTVYLSGVVNNHLRPHAGRPELGILAQPGTLEYLEELERFAPSPWGFDNGCFAEWLCQQGRHSHAPGTCRFNAGAWFDCVTELLPRGARAPAFVAAPDRVADCAGTWERSGPWFDRIRAAGHRAALVAQDGLELELERRRIPWDAFDALFIGGSDAWKVTRRGGPLTPWVYRLIEEANARGKHTHVGRVNSGVRWRSCVDAGADTCDGTFLKHAGGPDGVSRMLEWFADTEGGRLW